MKAKMFCGAAIAIGIEVLIAAGAGADDPKARRIMGEIVEAMRVVLPLSLADDRFLDPANRDRIIGALEKLTAHAEQLDRHGSDREAGFAYLSESLARDAKSIERRFVDGRPEEARFLLHHITETCVACHSLLPDARPHPLGEQLLNDPVVAALPADERVTLEVATRQFERALVTYESIFSDPQNSVESIDLEGHFEGYLEVSLRVSKDPQRAIDQLRAIAARPDLPERIRLNLRSWIASLESLSHQHDDTAIKQARQLIGPINEPHPASDLAALVGLIAASGVLHRFVAGRPASAPMVAEAYYLLGVIESRVGRSFWASQTEHFLEASIRADPDGPFAGEAFALLDEFVTSGFTGSSGINIPRDVAEHMNELQQLMDKAQASGSRSTATPANERTVN
jgi:hypothetical protein